MSQNEYRCFCAHGLREAQFTGVDGQTPPGITLPPGATYAALERCCEIPVGKASVSAEVNSDAPETLRNRVGVTLTQYRADGGAICEDYLDTGIQNGRLSFQGAYDLEPGAVKLRLHLYAKWFEGRVNFTSPQLEFGAPLPERKARIISTRLTYQEGETKAMRRQRIRSILERIGEQEPRRDLILFTEDAFTMGLANLTKEECSEPIPGPGTELLSEMASKLNCNIACGVEEDEHGVFRNSCVLINRKGTIAGIYHKVHLTINESRNGVVPGSDFPVFDLDFAKVGVSICWDNWFGESARALRLNGAELLLVPIAGDGIPTHRQHVWPARAVEHGMAAAFSPFSVSEDGIGPAQIFDQMGNLLAEAHPGTLYAAADVVFSKRYRTRYLSVGNAYGEGRSLYVAERRPGCYATLQ
ncbi:MAG: carbon-nitrogen hydrolase family protein [Victivallales bacterium]|nr:carbon-nitrogen hydrolase family protein [Victivallales bacterium]